MTESFDADPLKVLRIVSDAVIYLGEETKVHATLWRGVLSLRMLPQLLQMLREFAREKGHPQPEAFDSQMAQMIRDTPTKFAEEIERSDFFILNAHGLVGLWSAVEVAVDDLLFAVLSGDEAARQAVTDSNPKIDFGVDPNEPQIRKLMRNWSSATHESSLTSRWRVMLREVGIEVEAAPEIDAVVDEANEVRNCLLHRSGIVDERTAQKAPALAEKVGKRLMLGRKAYGRYLEAVHNYGVRLLTAVTRCRHVRVRPS